MYTVETVLETLKRFDIGEDELDRWEKQLGLDIPVDEYGRKNYSPHHVNLFKNVKKHLALGRTIDEVKQIIQLPGLADASQVADGQMTPVNGEQTTGKPVKKNPYASTPKRPTMNTEGKGMSEGAANVVNLVRRLTSEKDQLYKKLIETEKLNSHLYSANNMFHARMKEMSQRIQNLREEMNENHNIKLMGDKSKLQEQLLNLEKQIQAQQNNLVGKDQTIASMEQQLVDLQSTIQQYQQREREGFNAEQFCGEWMENGQLIDVVYDNFGINIENDRVRLFRISEIPERHFGRTAVINTTYQYETNKLWHRDETLTVTYMDNDTLEGELVAEYILDGVPVAKAIYRVTCERH